MKTIKAIGSVGLMTLFLYCGFGSVLWGGGGVLFSDSFETVGPSGLPVGWDTWEPIQPGLSYQSESKLSRTGARSFQLAGFGNEHAKGSLRKKIDNLTTGRFYKFSVFYTIEGIDSGINDKIIPVVKYGQDRNFTLLFPSRVEDGWVRAECVLELPEKAKGTVSLELFAGWIPDGKVYWDDVLVEELGDYQPTTNNVKVGVIDAVPPSKGSSLDNCDFYVSQINALCAEEQPDVICLTELFNGLNVVKDAPDNGAVSVNSEYMTRIKQAAKANRVNLVGSFAEIDGGTQFNTGFLINREGELVDWYRKAQLAETEILFSARSRGDELKIMQADFGKIGILICYDYHFPEFARSLSLMGADMLFVPIAADGRLNENEVRTGMEHVGKAITLENRIPVVFARYNGKPGRPSRIIDLDATVIAESKGRPYFTGHIDLAKTVNQWTGANFKAAYLTFRRPPLYDVIVEDTLKLLTEDGLVQIPVSDVGVRSR